MTLVLDAVFENGVFKPVERVPLSDGERVSLVVQSEESTTNMDLQIADRLRRFRAWVNMPRNYPPHQPRAYHRADFYEDAE